MAVFQIKVLSLFLCCLLPSALLVHGDVEYEATILTPHIKNGNITLARSLSKLNPTNFMGVNSYAAYFTVNEKYNSNMFFWYFPHSSAMEVPWIIWLQGGPGITSLLGVFDGIGPFKLEHGELKLKNTTWASDYSLLFIDNPVGAGFSFTQDERGYSTSECEVGENLLEFLDQFLQVFPELRKAPLFLVGSSYAGKYVPTFASYIHKWKKDNPINFKGLAIGNGLIDPKSQLAEGHSSLCRVLGLLQDKDMDKLKTTQKECVDYIDQGEMIKAANKFNESIEFIKKRSGVSVYNFDQDPSTSAPPLEQFVTRDETREQIHVGSTPFNFNNQHVYNTMLPDIMNTTKPYVEELLEHYGVMSFTGQLDIILPYSSVKPFYSQLKWSKRKEYQDAPRKRLRSASDGNIVGYRKAGGNFVEVLIRHAGHMVSKDQPEVCKYVMNIFVDEFK